MGASRSDFDEAPCPGQLRACAPRIDIGQAAETWRQQLSPTAEVVAGAGVSAVRTRQSPRDPFTVMTYPTFEASFQRAGAGDASFTLRIAAQVAPVVDARTATADYRAEGSAALSAPLGRATLHGVAATSRSVATVALAPATLLRISMDIDFRVTRAISCGVGARYAWQSQEPLGAFSTAAALVHVTVHAPPTRF